MSIQKSELRTSVKEALDEVLEGQTEKERGEAVDSVVDRLSLDFDVVDDEADEEEESPDYEED